VGRPCCIQGRKKCDAKKNKINSKLHIGQGDYSKIKLGIENGFKWDEFTPNFLCIRSKRMEGEKPSKIKTIKLIRLLVNRKNYLI
jgi:hypothetical protein